MPVFGHVATAMATPFREDGSLDIDGCQKLARHLVEHGTDTIVVAGTTGESPTLYGDETWDLLRAVKEAVGSDGKVIVGTGSNDTRHALLTTQQANQIGVDGVLVVTPYYNRPDAAGMLAHFSLLAAETDAAVLLYDIPARTACEIPIEVLTELAGIGNIVGVKDATGDIAKATRVLSATVGAPGGFEVYAGAEELTLPMMAIGAAGVVSVASHLAGTHIAEMCRAASTDRARAMQLHHALLPLVDALFAAPSPAPLKGALARLDLPSGPVRLPLVDAPKTVVDAVLNALTALDAAAALEGTA
jgi:4-hydroxy-tetrahydrodipicolinate synthase